MVNGLIFTLFLSLVGSILRGLIWVLETPNRQVNLILTLISLIPITAWICYVGWIALNLQKTTIFLTAIELGLIVGFMIPLFLGISIIVDKKEGKILDLYQESGVLKFFGNRLWFYCRTFTLIFFMEISVVSFFLSYGLLVTLVAIVPLSTLKLFFWNYENICDGKPWLGFTVTLMVTSVFVYLFKDFLPGATLDQVLMVALLIGIICGFSADQAYRLAINRYWISDRVKKFTNATFWGATQPVRAHFNRIGRWLFGGFNRIKTLREIMPESALED